MTKVTDRYTCRVCRGRYRNGGRNMPAREGDLVMSTRIPGLRAWSVRVGNWWTAGAAWGWARTDDAVERAYGHFHGSCHLKLAEDRLGP